MERIPLGRRRWFAAPCHLCNQDTLGSTGLCPSCENEWQALLGWPRCPGCATAHAGAGLGGGERCGQCAVRARPFDRAVAAVDLDPSARHLLHRLKYHQDFSTLPLLVATLLAPVNGEAAPDAVVPMPLHPSRRRQRGFNQAELLARGVARSLRLPVHDRGVRRVRDTGSLTDLAAASRRRVLKGAFVADGALPAHVAIVDDVMTTGSSAAALTRVLKEAGVERVDVWTLARTP